MTILFQIILIKRRKTVIFADSSKFSAFIFYDEYQPSWREMQLTQAMLRLQVSQHPESTFQDVCSLWHPQPYAHILSTSWSARPSWDATSEPIAQML
jgi:hypothetical protein